jgi:hypothetical protein
LPGVPDIWNEALQSLLWQSGMPEIDLSFNNLARFLPESIQWGSCANRFSEVLARIDSARFLPESIQRGSCANRFSEAFENLGSWLLSP